MGSELSKVVRLGFVVSPIAHAKRRLNPEIAFSSDLVHSFLERDFLTSLEQMFEGDYAAF